MVILANIKPIEEVNLKTILKEYQAQGQNWDKETKYIIIKSMLTYIGSTDSELRDQLIYSSFCKLVLDNQIEHGLLIELLACCLTDELLFKGVGENGTDSVFTRSFTTLLIALILYKDNQDDFLNQNMVHKVKDKLIDYIKIEEDLRGFVSDKGWAHSIAHVADAFEQLVKSSKLKPESYTDIISPLWNKIFVYDYVYIHDEDERILIPILEILNRGFKIEEVEILLKCVPITLKQYRKQIAEEQYWILVANCKLFLKSLYTKLSEYPNLNNLQKNVYQCLNDIL